ncbi:undecaprenyl-diphosphate phosphatase [Hyphococcus flavus]|uniref:Undecaprenyl-diphosphatase n=1 Tax=Hyphococcus flavus TaxID=1866326 RepID=A0AAE9ZJM3_9PROT|nr:undecaprenyl-diphosphate phosphatase [Hyphococcus flavus]WDI31770.1 undecaprenyl-diphosphate phosphatase [Hyphococcus flavus]
MTLIQLVVLAVIQGITEFLPISSSAHLILAPLTVRDWQDQGPLIDIAAHVGSLGAVLLYFRAETAMLFRGGIDTLRFRRSDDRKLFLFIAAATIPTLSLAAVFVLFDLTSVLRSPVVIGWVSIIFGALLWHADRSKGEKAGLDRMTWREAMTIGLAQMCALVPGVSRSGVTMTMARYLGWSRPEAARFSMLLAIPTILALGAFACIEILREGANATLSSALIVAVLSFICAYAAIAVLMRLVQTMSFTPFVIYRIVFGIVLLTFAGALTAN